VDTATYFTTAGQAFILLLIQLGGLGILTFTTLVILALGRRLSLHHEAVTATAAEVVPEVDFRHLVRNIVRFTFFLEAAGAAVLFLLWIRRFPAPQALWHAVFQSVSAFCNAGFSTFSDSLMGFQGSPLALSTVMALIVLGGLGFLTLEELHLRWKARKKPSPVALSLHSKLVLGVTAILIVGGGVIYAVLEWRNTLGGLPALDRMVNAFFMSVTARTAGFNTVDYHATADSTDFLTVLLMSVGGSPGSTAGGLKTTTFAVLVLAAVARLRGRQLASVWNRTLPQETVQRSVGLFVLGFVVVTLGILLFAVDQLPPLHPSEHGNFLAYMFEAVSAFNTVGLSMGVTAGLTGFSKFMAVVLMYVGRVGPLTVGAAISLQREATNDQFRYAYEDVIIG
jgi:trk system potassium uptake protein TrkH